MIISSNNRRLLLCVRPTLGSLTRLFSKFVDDAMVTYLPVPCHWISAESILASEKFSQQIQTIKFWLENSVSLMTNFLLHFSYQIHRLVLKVLLSIHFVLFHISFLILFFYFFFFQISLVYLFVLYVPFSLLRSLKMQVFFFLFVVSWQHLITDKQKYFSMMLRNSCQIFVSSLVILFNFIFVLVLFNF